MIENREMARKHSSEMLEWITSYTDLQEQCVAIGWMIEQRQNEIARLSQYRRTTLKQLHNTGQSMRAIAKNLGLSVARVQQLLSPNWK